jgi:regulator of sirC expression with transglutaminase-like and TPR domain
MISIAILEGIREAIYTALAPSIFPTSLLLRIDTPLELIPMVPDP